MLKNKLERTESPSPYDIAQTNADKGNHEMHVNLFAGPRSSVAIRPDQIVEQGEADQDVLMQEKDDGDEDQGCDDDMSDAEGSMEDVSSTTCQICGLTWDGYAQHECDDDDMSDTEGTMEDSNEYMEESVGDEDSGMSRTSTEEHLNSLRSVLWFDHISNLPVDPRLHQIPLTVYTEWMGDPSPTMQPDSEGGDYHGDEDENENENENENEVTEPSIVSPP
jgi:hypothetical protein